MNKQCRFEKKIKITGKLEFTTAFHIGSGQEGDLGTDMGVLKDSDRNPLLPGSSLKGNFRATAEKLASYLGLSACLLDKSLSGFNCVGDQGYFRQNNEDFNKLKTEAEKLQWMQDNTCDVCRLFGSPICSSRIFFTDGLLKSWAGAYEIRDGVVIDRDSETAVDGLKYDFEATPAGAVYEIKIELENPEDKDLALIAAVLCEWESGFKLGGFTSRGLGSVKLFDKKVKMVDYTRIDSLKNYLLSGKMQESANLFSDALDKILKDQEEAIC
jgi:CRISPR-associated RAMP protein (TIGR02581 family)